MQTWLSWLNPGGILVALVISPVLFQQRREQGRGRSMLAVLLLFCALNALAVEILLRGNWIPYRRILPLFGPLLLMLGPLLNLYILMITGNFRHSRADIPHFLPAIAYTVLLALRFPLLDIIIGFLVLHLLAYFALVFVRVTAYRRLLRENLSTPGQADPAWLLWFCGVLAILFAGLFLIFFLYLHTDHGNLVPGIFSFLLTLTITLLGYRSLLQKPYPAGAKAPESLPEDRTGPRAQSLELAVMRETLAHHMETNKPFRDPDLTLPDLAEETGINRNVLSRIVNELEGMNFSDYINSARLEYARLALSDPARRDQTILQIAFDAGFNSKTTFNTFFRRKLGITPTSYREKSLR